MTRRGSSVPGMSLRLWTAASMGRVSLGLDQRAVVHGVDGGVKLAGEEGALELGDEHGFVAELGEGRLQRLGAVALGGDGAQAEALAGPATAQEIEDVLRLPEGQGGAARAEQQSQRDSARRGGARRSERSVEEDDMSATCAW